MKLDDVKKLQHKKYRTELGHFLVEGEHLVLELQKAAQHNTDLNNCELFVTENYQAWSTDFKKTLVTEKQMAQISDTKTPQGIVALVPFFSITKAPFFSPVNNSKKERAIYLHEVQDPGNLGTIFRTLAWFGNFRLLLSPNAVDPYNPKVVRSSMGAIFHVPMELDVSLESLTSRFQKIACLDMNGKSLSDSEFKTFDCYVFGNEARGVPRENLTALHAKPFTIQGCDSIESLNLASAINICAYELNRA
jgi:RNA methyltransferase, TrmH family